MSSRDPMRVPESTTRRPAATSRAGGPETADGRATPAVTGGSDSGTPDRRTRRPLQELLRLSPVQTFRASTPLLACLQPTHAHLRIDGQEDRRVAERDDRLSPARHRSRENPGRARSEHLAHEADPLGDGPREGVRRHRRHPVEVVAVGVRYRPRGGDRAPQSRRPRAARTHHVESAWLHPPSVGDGWARWAAFAALGLAAPPTVGPDSVTGEGPGRRHA